MSNWDVPCRVFFFSFNFVRQVDWGTTTRGLSQIWLQVRRKNNYFWNPTFFNTLYWWHARNYGINMAISTFFFPLEIWTLFPQNMYKSEPLFICCQVAKFHHKRKPWCLVYIFILGCWFCLTYQIAFLCAFVLVNLQIMNYCFLRI
jgi:hypothetical protein